jgi:hypothetical protein
MPFGPVPLTENRRHLPLGGAWVRCRNDAETLHDFFPGGIAWLGAWESPLAPAPEGRFHLLTQPP